MPQATAAPLFLALTALTAADLAAAPVLRMVLSENQAQGVKRVSLVRNPAIEKGWVALAAAEAPAPRRVHLSTETDGPRAQVLTGPVLVPGQKILRLGADGKPFYVTFEAADILAIARRFAAEGQHNHSNQDHATVLSGNVFYESWIVADPAQDKSTALGLDEVAGTWMLSAHVPDADFWQREVVSGNITGFSIEGLFDTEEITLAATSAPLPPMKKNWMFSLLVAMAKVAGIKLTKTELKDGTIVDVAEDGTVSSLDAEGNVTGPAKDGPYELADGTAIEVKDGKKVPAKAAGQPVAAADEAVTAATEMLKGLSAETPVDEAKALLEKALEALAGKPATAVEAAALRLEAVPLAGGKTVNFDPMTRKLTDEAGALLPSGDYQRTDGTCFRVNVDQYCYEIPAADYKAIAETATAAETVAAELAAVKLQLTAAEAKLSTEPDGQRVHLSGTGAQDKPLPRHLAFLQAHQS
ncbi:XkdF-like putative serine protease domain-containing protein [Hymenobacter sp.]|uniref:XkdF-like putative serine protease domain-containing protein n=1 Tax=Hymenobacter sp. TaxID=1898978 RepID=UPI00286A940F|nr:XkdF-like putative serine protease domain-containing protein [Hymenobacter sp.]